MKIYLLWYNEWKTNYILGIFETEQEAERWKEYFIEHPEQKLSYDMATNQNKEDLEDRLEITEMDLNSLHPDIKIDNLKYLEFMEGKKNV